LRSERIEFDWTAGDRYSQKTDDKGDKGDKGSNSAMSGRLSPAIEAAAGPPYLLALFGQLAAAMFRIGLRVFDGHIAARLFLRFLPLTFASGQCFVVRFT
jgi:hypothetical protein